MLAMPGSLGRLHARVTYINSYRNGDRSVASWMCDVPRDVDREQSCKQVLSLNRNFGVFCMPLQVLV